MTTMVLWRHTRRPLDGVVTAALRYRFALLALVAAGVWLSTSNVGGWGGGDWVYFTRGARALTGPDGLHTYARMPALQFGPLPLAAAIPLKSLGPHAGWPATSALCMVLGLATVYFTEQVACLLAGADNTRRIQLITLSGGAFLLKAWSLPAVGSGHLDDVLALTLTAVACREVARGRAMPAAVALGLGAACKPWVLLALPLAAAVEGRRTRGLLVAVVASGLPWVPFLVADHRTINVLHVYLPVGAESTLHALGMHVGAHPTWARSLQLIVGVLLSAVVVRRGRWYLVPMVAFAVRVNLDPAAFDYYTAGPVLGALIWDYMQPARWPGMRTALTCFALVYVRQDVILVLHMPRDYIVLALTRACVLIAPLLVSLSVRLSDEQGFRARTPASLNSFAQA